MLKFLLETKRKMLKIDLNITLKEEPDLTSRCWFTLFGPVRLGSWICLSLMKSTQMWANIPQ